MSDLRQMARSTAHVILADAARASQPFNIEPRLVDAFERGALWAMTRAAHALAITRTASTEAERPGVERAQRAIATTHQGMLDDVRSAS